MSKLKPLVLAILDGWGVAPDSSGNAITRAKTPAMDRILREYPAMTLFASGAEVGLSFGDMGNSEVGHLNIGAGRVYYQTLPRIDQAISSGMFFKNTAFLEAVQHVKKYKSALHIIGLVSHGKVHSSQDHLYQLLSLAREQKIKKVYIHAILDGRDTNRDSGAYFIEELQKVIKENKVGKIATISGRFYAMDRDNRWDRIEKAYNAIAKGIAEVYAKNPVDAIKASYEKGVFDEEFIPTVIGKEDTPIATVTENDAVIYFNFRPDRARELTKAFVLPALEKFPRDYIKNLFFVTMTEYEKEIPVTVAYPPNVVVNCLAEVISKAGLTQLHIAETEKYAHITFFLNGTREDEFNKEDRSIIPSPQVATYDQAPDMSAYEITKEVIKAIQADKYDCIFLNFANPDMVGHTGNLGATIKAVEITDDCIQKIYDHVLAKNGVLLITADHGNAEEVTNVQTGKMDKEHSTNSVPFIVVGNDYRGLAAQGGDAPNGDLSLLPPVGMLSDVAPTILHLLEIEQPPEMTGRSLL
jgi:2,3-bisphosphoglycerate-independent phosphoglycerate mutase